ncbi:MAG: hypothetical protein ACOVNR_11680, partial [Chitinophagaceae bacterium]
QNLTGIWRGYFVQRDFDMFSGEYRQEKYKYEVQILQGGKAGVEGVTYSYRTTVFYGKAKCTGIFGKKDKTLTLKETKMEELKISDGSQPCLMTCYLDYEKAGKKEILSGTYTSENMQNKGECGNGSVYLEKVPTSDFELEPFLLNKKKTESEAKPLLKQAPKISSKDAFHPKAPISSKAVTNNAKKTGIKPGAEEFMVSKKKEKPTTIGHLTPTDKEIKEDEIPEEPVIKVTPKPVPSILLQRKNELVQSFSFDESAEVDIEYYDNGQIDNDTISVYHNNELVINKARLSYQPIHYKFTLNAENPKHEIITIANNLGTIPPNTAMMIIRAGNKKHSVFITSDEKKNAKIVIEWKGKNGSSIEEKPLRN